MQIDRGDQAIAQAARPEDRHVPGQRVYQTSSQPRYKPQPQPLSPSLTTQGFSLAGERLWQEATLPLTVPTLPGIPQMPMPPELSPAHWITRTPARSFAGMPIREKGPHSETLLLFEPEKAFPQSTWSMQTFLSILLYRGWLIGITILLTWLLLWLQASLDHVHIHTTPLRMAVQWTELTWLTPVPLALILWIGWFFFAEAARPNPAPISVPFVQVVKQGLLAFAPAQPVRLVFRFVTRGDNVEILRDSIIAVHQAFAHYQQRSGPFRIEVISECPIALNLPPDPRLRIYIVPPAYATRNHSRFKARALTYLQQQVQAMPEDWYIYLDEESLINEHLLAGIYRFIWRTLKAEKRARQKGKRQPAGYIGQGAILYQGGNWFFRGADALRTADDLGRFRLQYALGIPIFGIHGSYIVLRGVHDTLLSFDVGSENSITEDAAWALRAWSQGFRFAWVEGYLHEQPPQKARDFVKQRSRWLSGIRIVIRDQQTPFRYRLCLGLFTVLWQLAFLPFLIALIALFVHASPFPWLRLPADFAWATFTLAYLQGIDLQGKYPHPFLKKGWLERQYKRIISWLLILCSIWYALLEAAGVIYSFKPKQGFFVIQKPSMAAENQKQQKPARSGQ